MNWSWQRSPSERLARCVTVFGGLCTSVSVITSPIVASVVLGAFPRVLIYLMAANQTAGSSSEHSVMAGIVPCHPTHDGTF
jgi:hypothetical protein